MLNLFEIYQIIFSYRTIHVVVCLFTFLTSIFGDWGKGLRQRSFSKAMHSIGPMLEKATDSYKKKLYEDLDNGQTPLTILEVGIGRGATFKYYPKTRPCSLIAVEPDKSCEAVVRKTLKSAEYKNIHLKKFYTTSAEDMSQIGDGSVDVVLTTEALCSVPNTLKTLQEICRVLKPGGKYYFFEHILHEPGTTWRKFQDFLLWTNIWPYLTGCRFFEHPEILRDFHGFSNCRGTKVHLKFSETLLHPDHVIAPHYYGIAIK